MASPSESDIQTDDGSVEYWKRQAADWKYQYEECRRELDEFTTGSREFEQELERQLEEAERSNHTLKNDLRALQEDIRFAKEQEQRLTRRAEALEDQVKNYDAQKQSMAQYRRELEQKNDELETSYRNLTASLSDHAKRIEALIEEKALLENELEGTRGQKEAEQRLRDELRDLQGELAARNKSDESRQNAARERRLTMDLNLFNSEHELQRLQSMSSGDFTPNGHNSLPEHNHREREAELKSALAKYGNSPTLIQNLIGKISSLEAEVQSVRRGSLLKTSNGQH
ncbi:hypothetical protein BV898_03335 [Hypsibius exemplaris]|uniref:NUDE domain-containing protein n=1 Tax=Hypsibius exemplaris TaxID=2072580 RepID=A0A1W0X5N4_HYPEX|nr:hypothetical protein BV898_03335 [Hypsibius exemplaris]